MLVQHKPKFVMAPVRYERLMLLADITCKLAAFPCTVIEG